MNSTQNRVALPKIGGFSARELSILIGLMTPTLIALIDVGMLGVALPVIQTDFGVSVDRLAWVVAAGLILRVPMMPIYGRVGDIFGKKPLYLIGLGIFIGGSLIALTAPTYFWLICGRLLQGFGGAASLPLAMALIVDAFPEERRGRALGIWNTSAPAGITLGPVLGGVVVDTLGWQAIFVISAGGTVLALGVVAWLVPAPTRPEIRPTVDWWGAVAFGLAITGALLLTTTVNVVPFGSPVNLIVWGITGLALLSLIWNALNRPNPFISLDMVKNRQFVAPSVAISLRMFTHDGVRFLTVLYLANVFSQSPSNIGLFMLFYAVPLMIGVAYGGFLADQWASRTIGIMALLAIAVGMMWLSFVNPNGTLFILAPGLMISGLGAVCLAPFTKTAVVALGKDRVGMASGLYNTLRFVGLTVSTPLLGLLLAREFTQHGGLETVTEPYQLGFQLLAGVAVIGAVAAALIPKSENSNIGKSRTSC